MANKALFSSTRGALLPATDTVNRHGVGAYEYSPCHKLAQYAVTGCLSNTFYAAADEQLTTVLELIPELDGEFVAKCAVYARRTGMKDVPFQMLTALGLKQEEWARVALRGGWQMVRMNLNTFARHGVFALDGLAERIAAKLVDREAIEQARVFPFQLMAAYQSLHRTVPAVIREALQDAMEIAIENVPSFGPSVAVCPDVSGSMSSPVTGARRGATSVIRCVDVAALMTAAVVRKNKQAIVLPFEVGVRDVDLSARDSVMTNARKLASIRGGGTNCAAPLEWLKERNLCPDLVILISDNQSWVNAKVNGPTQVMRVWEQMKRRNQGARLVCIDLQAHGTTQAVERPDILNVGGFSDEVFEIVARFTRGELGTGHWMECIEAVEL
jgi:60 kDa SS-A/Ro ribonucleoprotein